MTGGCTGLPAQLRDKQTTPYGYASCNLCNSALQEMQDVERGIFQLHNGLSQASRDVDRLGTKADTQDLRDRLKNRLHDLKAKAMRLGTQVRDLHGEQKSEKTAKLTKNLQVGPSLPICLKRLHSKQETAHSTD